MTKVGPLCNTKNPPPMLIGCLRSIPLGCGKRMPTGTPNCRLANPSLYNQIPYWVALFLLQPAHPTIPKRTLPKSRPPKNANPTFSRAYKNKLIFEELACPGMKHTQGTCIAMFNTGKISWKNFINLDLKPLLFFLKVFGPTLIGRPPLLLSMTNVRNSILWTSMYSRGCRP